MVAHSEQKLNPPTATGAVGVRGLGPRADTAAYGEGARRAPTRQGRLVAHSEQKLNQRPQPAIAGLRGLGPRVDTAAYGEGGRRPPTSTSRLVALSELKLNSQLVTYLRRCEAGSIKADVRAEITSPLGRQHRPWAIERRLSKADIQTIIADFLSGTPKHVLATRYSVSLSGLKNLLRRRGIRRDGRPDMPD